MRNVASGAAVEIPLPALPCITFSLPSPVLYCALYSILDGGGVSEVQSV